MPSRSQRPARERQARHAAVALALAAALALYLAPVPVLAAYLAGVASGIVLAAAAAAGSNRAGIRLARCLGIRAREVAMRPVPRAPRPASTPIHDTAEHAQKGI